LRHPAVLECAVVGLPDVRWGEQVVAVVVLKPGFEASEEELLADVRRCLARYKHPRQLVLSSELPKTALGKIKKDQLVQLLTGHAGTAASPSVNSLRFP
jgi:fatty-acyl-CoA synthase